MDEPSRLDDDSSSSDLSLRFPGYIHYDILEDGCCSYCGRQADLIELPDGNICYSEECTACENYNQELWFESHIG